MVRVLTVNGVTDLDNAALGHVLRIVYCNKVVMSHRATLVKLFKHYDTQSIQMLFSTIFTKNINAPVSLFSVLYIRGSYRTINYVYT